jgi:hypothetical protein
MKTSIINTLLAGLVLGALLVVVVLVLSLQYNKTDRIFREARSKILDSAEARIKAYDPPAPPPPSASYRTTPPPQHKR